MDPMTMMAIGSVAAPVIGGLLGGNAAKAQRAEAARMREAALKQYENLKIPDIEKMRLYLEENKYEGDLTPEMLDNPDVLQDSQLQSYEQDQQLRDMQLNALQKYEDMSDTGMSEADLALQRETERNVDAQGKADQAAILQNMAQRGIAGSGNELAARLAGAQQTTDTRASSYDKLAAEARQRALMAMEQGASLASGMSQQDFNEANQKAQAMDAIRKFNLTNAQSVAQQNVGTRNAAMERNLNARQQMNNSNTALRNQQQQYNKNLYQQDYNNQFQLAGAKANAYMGQAQAAAAQGAATANQYASIGGAIGGGLGGIASFMSKSAQKDEQKDKE